VARLGPKTAGPARSAVGLTARALWWRRGASATLLVVATVTTGAAALGPIYARAAGESTLRDRLTQAPADATGLAFARVDDVAQKTAFVSVDATLPAPGSIRGYPTWIHEINTPDLASLDGAGGNGRVDTRIVWRDGACAHLVLVAGHCPEAAGDAIMSSRTTSGGYGWRLGSRVRLTATTVDVLGPDGAVQVGAPLHIVGIYRPQNISDPFWFGRNYFIAHPYAGPFDGPDTIDTLFVDRSFWPTLSEPSDFHMYVDYPLDPTQIRLKDEPQLRQSVVELAGHYVAAGPQDTTLTTSVTNTLDAADRERGQLNVSTILVTVQLALLAWLVLYQVVADAAEARGNEIALAKLRGFSAFATLRFGLGEPLTILALAIPLGLVAAWVGIGVMARIVLVPGTPVAPNLGALGGALVGFAGGAVAAALAARRTLTRPVLEQWRRVPQNVGPGLATFFFDLVVVAAAIAGLVALRGQGVQAAQPRPASLLGPGLLVLAVALLGVRLLPFFGRGALAPTRASKRIGLFLAVRQVVRRPAGLRLAALLAVAIGLATFAIDGEAVAAGNRATRAALEVGASQVVETQFDLARTPMAITHAADPGGTWAMAAATWLPAGGTVRGEVLAVDSSRFAAVANWPGGDQLSAAAVARAIGPKVPPPVTFTGTRIRVRATSLVRSGGAQPLVTVELRPPGRKAVPVRLGELVPGSHDYTGTVACATGCTLVRIVLDRPIDYFGTISGSWLVESVAEGGATGGLTTVDAGLTSAGAWRAAGDPASSDRVTTSAQGLHDDYSSTGGASPAVGHDDSPQPLPVVATPTAIQHDSLAGPPAMIDTNQTSAAYEEAGTVSLLPVVLDFGVVVDVNYLRDQIPGVDSEAHWQIWIAAGAPADALQRLTRAGLVVQNSHTQAQQQSLLARQGTALALLLLVACAIAGAVLAAGATALAVAVTGRRRSFELAALRAVGVSRRSLLRSCVFEQLILLGTGFVLGLPTGIVAARLALPEIPEFSDVTPVPLDFRPHVLAIATFGAVVLAILVVTAVLAGRALMRSAVPNRLREAAP